MNHDADLFDLIDTSAEHEMSAEDIAFQKLREKYAPYLPAKRNFNV